MTTFIARTDGSWGWGGYTWREKPTYTAADHDRVRAYFNALIQRREAEAKGERS